MGNDVVPQECSAFEAMLIALYKHFGTSSWWRSRSTWAADDIQQLVDAGWEQVGVSELRYSFSNVTGDERSVNVFAAAHQALEDEFGEATCQIPGRDRSATWIAPNVVMSLMSQHARLLELSVGRRSENLDADKADGQESVDICECHCHCEAEGLDWCHDDYCGYDLADDEDDADDEDNEDPKRCGECHCCTCWKNCGCDTYPDMEDCGCGCYVCVCDCYSQVLAVDSQGGDDEPLTVENQWPAFAGGLAQALSRLGRGEGIDLSANGYTWATFHARDHEIDCAIARNRSEPAKHGLTAEQNSWLIQRGWDHYGEFDRTYRIRFAANYGEYVTTAESVVTVLHDFLGITSPADLEVRWPGLTLKAATWHG